MDSRMRIIVAGQVADKVLMVCLGAAILWNQRRARLRDEVREAARQEVFRALSDPDPERDTEEVLADEVNQPEDPLWDQVKDRVAARMAATEGHNHRVGVRVHEQGQERAARRNRLFRSISEGMNTRSTNR